MEFRISHVFLGHLFRLSVISSVSVPTLCSFCPYPLARSFCYMQIDCISGIEVKPAFRLPLGLRATRVISVAPAIPCRRFDKH